MTRVRNAHNAALAALFASFLIFAVLPGTAADGSADDIARILAGIEPRVDSPLAGLTRDSDWRLHASSFDAAWKSLEARQLSKIRVWSAKNITRPQKTMLYMFSGPDFLYADVFFPEATTYVLSGLEPVGGMPDVSQSRRSLSGTLVGNPAASDGFWERLLSSSGACMPILALYAHLPACPWSSWPIAAAMIGFLRQFLHQFYAGPEHGAAAHPG